MSTEIEYGDGKLTVTRVYDAPREAVFEAWVETSKVEQWWGCAQTTNVKSEIERRVGGKYAHVMTLGEQGDHGVQGKLIEYDPPARLAFTEGEGPAAMTVTVDFFERDGGTEVRLVHENIPNEVSPYVKEGWTAAFGKLGKFLTQAA